MIISRLPWIADEELPAPASRTTSGEPPGTRLGIQSRTADHRTGCPFGEGTPLTARKSVVSRSHRNPFHLRATATAASPTAVSLGAASCRQARTSPGAALADARGTRLPHPRPRLRAARTLLSRAQPRYGEGVSESRDGSSQPTTPCPAATDLEAVLRAEDWSVRSGATEDGGYVILATASLVRFRDRDVTFRVEWQPARPRISRAEMTIKFQPPGGRRMQLSPVTGSVVPRLRVPLRDATTVSRLARGSERQVMAWAGRRSVNDEAHRLRQTSPRSLTLTGWGRSLGHRRAYHAWPWFGLWQRPRWAPRTRIRRGRLPKGIV